MGIDSPACLNYVVKDKEGERGARDDRQRFPGYALAG